MTQHHPVMLKEVLAAMEGALALRPGEVPRFLDGTFGGGGHTRGLLGLDARAEVWALDRDPAAGERAQRLAKEVGERFRFVDMNFADLETLEASGFTGAVFDLGLSSFHVEEGERGFSFRQDAPLDMRMDPRHGQSAAEFLETAPEEDLVRAIRDYGEEPRWRRVVESILRHRGTGKLERTLSIATLVEDAVGNRPRSGRFSRIHPATRTFQGVRMWVNGEMEALERMLPAAFDKLAPGGVLAVISFHSLEDRVVKRFFRRMAGRPEHGRDSRLQDERLELAHLPRTKPIRPTEQEISENPRSRSALLRLLQKNE